MVQSSQDEPRQVLVEDAGQVGHVHAGSHACREHPSRDGGEPHLRDLRTDVAVVDLPVGADVREGTITGPHTLGAEPGVAVPVRRRTTGVASPSPAVTTETCSQQELRLERLGSVL